jgi:citronellol/citronellal dehydrogenase
MDCSAPPIRAPVARKRRGNKSIIGGKRRQGGKMTSLKGKTLFVSGGSRGIGLAIALRAARDGAHVAIAAKTAEPHPKLKGTIFTAADDIRAAGGQALPIVCDIRDETQVIAAVDKTVAEFGGIDICVNNASAISLADSQMTDMKRFDLMMGINTRGTFMVSKYCIPHLKKADNPHILMLSPPLDMQAKWFERSTAYTLAKFGMSMCVLGLSAELKAAGVAVNALWPRTTIATAAVGNLLGGDAMMRASRTPEIMGDAAYVIFTRPSREFTGQFCIDDKVLYESGVRDFEHYRVDPTMPLMSDFFVPDGETPPPGVSVSALPSVGEARKSR